MCDPAFPVSVAPFTKWCDSGRVMSRPSRLLPFSALLAGGICVMLTLFAGFGSTDAELQEYIVVRHTLYEAEAGIANGEYEVETSYFIVNSHRWAPSSIPVPVTFNSADVIPGHDVPAILQQAIQTWNAATPSTFSFVWQGSSSGLTGTCNFAANLDGLNTVKFVNDLPPGVLGQTCTVWPAGAGANTPLVEFDMEMDITANWTSGPTTPAGHYDLPSTILHELGHAAGLGHSNSSSAVMYFSLPNGTQKRALASDDVAGINAAYPGGGTATPTPSVSPSPTPTPFPPTATVPPPETLTYKVRAPVISRD